MLLNPAGREWPREGGVGPTPCSISPPRSGNYAQALHDESMVEVMIIFYRLTVSAAPFVDFIFPPSGPAGSHNQYTLLAAICLADSRRRD